MPFMEETEGSKKTFISQLGEKMEKSKVSICDRYRWGKKRKNGNGEINILWLHPPNTVLTLWGDCVPAN